jgi:signal transduction histidine kinase
MTSLRARLFGVWVLSLAASVAVGLLLVQLYHQSSTVLVERGEAALAQACELIEDRYAYYAEGWAGPDPSADEAGLAKDLNDLTALALSDMPAIAGGILLHPADISPATPQSQITAAALAGDGTSVDEISFGPRTVLSRACRLSGPIPDLAAWVSTEVEATPGYDALQTGLAVLMALVLSLTAGLTWLVTAWARQVRRVEAALAAHDSADLPLIAPTGEAELDRIARALNTAGERLRAARNEAEAALARAARAERMAALGRISAGVAHEIRNPIAAMRLRAEGALAVDPAQEPERAAARGRTALGAILGQIDRLDRLSAELLTMTQRRDPVRETVDVPAFLAACAADWANAAIRVEAAPGIAVFDAEMIRRVLDNLIQNALRHTPDGGEVVLRGRSEAGMLHIEVEDSGPGVPEALRDTLFEPFVTGRADGTGLGLAIAREMVQAHGGRIVLARATPGAILAFDLPQEAAP